MASLTSAFLNAAIGQLYGVFFSGKDQIIAQMVLSEFVNVLARLAYNSLPAAQRPSDFKTFRRSSSFKTTAASIADSCKHILQVVTRIESGFASCDP